MTQSSALPGFVALVALVAAFGGCSSSPAGSAPQQDAGDLLGLAATGSGAGPTLGSAGAGGTSTEPNPYGGGTLGAGGEPPGADGGSTGQAGTGQAGTTATGGSALDGTGGFTIDPGSGGAAGGSVDISGGAAGSTDISGGTAGSTDMSGGTAGSTDMSGGTAGSTDMSGGVAGSTDMSGGVAGSTDTSGGGTGGSSDEYGGTGNTTNTGGSGPPPPPDGGPPPGCVPTWFAKQINVLVLHDANVTNADTRGAMWVGGNLTGVGYDVGGDLPADPSCTRYDLAVGGNVTLSGCLVLHNGAAAYGGSLSATCVNGAQCGVFHAPADMPNFTQIAADVKANSTYFAGLPPNGTVSGTTLNGGSASCKIVVFNTSLCSFAGVTINIPADGTAIINSTCTNPTFTNGQTQLIMGGVAQPQCNGQQGTGGACNHVLYNFPNATTVTVSGMSAQGSILAPYAKFLGDGGNVAGEVVVDSMDTGVEFHAWFFEGCLDTTTC